MSKILIFLNISNIYIFFHKKKKKKALNFFFNFNISTNNIVNFKAAKMLWYLITTNCLKKSFQILGDFSSSISPFMHGRWRGLESWLHSKSKILVHIIIDVWQIPVIADKLVMWNSIHNTETQNHTTQNLIDASIYYLK